MGRQGHCPQDRWEVDVGIAMRSACMFHLQVLMCVVSWCLCAISE